MVCIRPFTSCHLSFFWGAGCWHSDLLIFLTLGMDSLLSPSLSLSLMAVTASRDICTWNSRVMSPRVAKYITRAIFMSLWAQSERRNLIHEAQ